MLHWNWPFAHGALSILGKAGGEREDSADSCCNQLSTGNTEAGISHMPDTVIIHFLQQLQASALLNGLSSLTTRKDIRKGSRQYYLSTLVSEQRCLSEQRWHYICLTATTPTHWQQRSPSI